MGCQQLYLPVDGNWLLAALCLPCLFDDGFGAAGVLNVKRPDHATSDAGCALVEVRRGTCVRLKTAGWHRVREEE
jgi:hypothetical protein